MTHFVDRLLVIRCDVCGTDGTTPLGPIGGGMPTARESRKLLRAKGWILNGDGSCRCPMDRARAPESTP